ncbi:MAG: helix-turn-helix domain-containing protein [Gammaproteobacteria bacterium]|nr:helix-turn-helix domain-containing protein [Gammaproteobacteria bacterium]
MAPTFAPRLTETQAAEFLNLSKKTLQAWRQSGEGPPYLKLGRAVRYEADAIRDWVKERERHSTSDRGRAA